MYGFVVTTAGEGLLARAAGGETLTITGTRVGSGSVAGESAARALTALIQDQAAGTYSTPEVSGGQLSMVVEYRNNLNGGLQAGFTLREFGVFARVGDDAPTLMYYAALGDRAPEVPPITEGLDVHRWPVAVAVSGELAVTVEDPSGAFVDDSKLQKYLPLAGGTMTGPLALDALQVGTKGKGVVVGLDNAGTLETPVVQVASQYGSGPAVLRGVAQAQQSGDALPKGQADGAYLPKSQKGQPGGVASLDGEGKVPGEQLPEMNYVQNITRTATVAAGQTIQAGDVVDLNDGGQVIKNIENIAAHQQVVSDAVSDVRYLEAIKLNETRSVVSWYWNSGDYHDDFCKALQIDNETGIGTTRDPISFYTKNSDDFVNLPIIRINDTRFVLACTNEEKAVLFFAGKLSGNSISYEPAAEAGGEVRGSYAAGVPLPDSRFFYIWPEEPANQLSAVVCTVDRPGADSSIVVDGRIESELAGTLVNATRLLDEGSGERVLVTYLDPNNSSCPTAVIATISPDNTITFGSAAVIDTTGKNPPVCCTDTDGDVIVFYGGQYIKVLSVSGDTIIPAPSALDMGISGNRQHILMVGTNIVAVWHDGSQHSYAAVITRDGTELTCGAPYEWLEGYAESAVMAVSETKFTILFAVESERLKSTTLEVWSGRISGSFVNESSQAIALEDGGAGESIELLFSGTAELPGIAEGAQILTTGGVQGYAPSDGWINVFPKGFMAPMLKAYQTEYRGTGTYGEDSPNVLIFPFRPFMVVISIKQSTHGHLQASTLATVFFNPMATASVPNPELFQVLSLQISGSSGDEVRTGQYANFRDRTLTWYGGTVNLQMNDVNNIYSVIAYGI